MPPPDYLQWSTEHAEDPVMADGINNAAKVLTDMREFTRRCAGDPSQINILIDTMIDQVIAVHEGDHRLALYSMTKFYGMAMRLFNGEPPVKH